jgi:lipopolysaccharide transport system ATP-binding protein
MDDREVILKVENLSKQYRLGLVGTGTLSHDFNRWWHRIRGKEDPYLKIGETNDRSTKGESEYVWALRDINFEVRRGEVLGIIGKNGAGKSTLLKILSRVTSPTTGSIKTKGRIASLLEVGTGFHGEMTGRENIYLNGAILGMTKKEISAKIDEIIEFSGCERYIDTPVKRYSSGMTVRLAFAVAAFLEPDILIVDEVLAVGDAEFQKKAIGKMQDISSGEGRTVIFVSHNLESIKKLCQRAILLDGGKVIFSDIVSEVIRRYTDHTLMLNAKKKWNNANQSSTIVMINYAVIHNESFEEKEVFDIQEKFGISINYDVIKSGFKIQTALNFFNSSELNLFDSHESGHDSYSKIKEIGNYTTTVWITGNLFNSGIIKIGVALLCQKPFEVYFHDKDALCVNMTENIGSNLARGMLQVDIPGLLRPKLIWKSSN